jgi:hypothetical protein
MTAPLLLDLLWPIALWLGMEEVRIAPGDTAWTPLEFVSYPWTHSLLMSVVWGVAFALLYHARSRDRRGAAVIALGVVSHWVLDVASHRADMPLAPGMALKLGLGLWNSPAATVIVESAMLVGGLWIYLAATRARDRTGTLALWSMVVLMVVLYFAASLGPPPPNAQALRTAALMTWLFVPWVFWIDRHRELRSAPRG